MNDIQPKVAAELIQILLFLPEEYICKIPKEEIEYLNKVKDNNYISNIQNVEDIKQSNMLEETKVYLAYFFINYLSTEEEKREYEIILKENEERQQKELLAKYDVNKVFEERKNKTNEIIPKEKALVKKEKNIFEFIINKIKKLLKR